MWSQEMTKNFIFQTMRAMIEGVYKPANNHEAVALFCFCEQRYFLSSRAAEKKPCACYLSWVLTQWRVRPGRPGTHLPALSAGSRHGRCRIQAQHYRAFPSHLWQAKSGCKRPTQVRCEEGTEGRNDVIRAWSTSWLWIRTEVGSTCQILKLKPITVWGVRGTLRRNCWHTTF